MAYEKVNSKITQIFVCVSMVLMLWACSNTKYLTDNQTLLVKTKVECDTKTINQDELKSILKQKANQKSLFFFRFYASIYNSFSRGKGSKFKKWIISHIGTEPVIFDEALASKSESQLLQYMNNKGYFQAKIAKKVSTKKKKTELSFSITANQPYLLKNIDYKCNNSEILSIIQKRSKNTFLVSGANFNVTNLENERDRLTKILNHNGYYFFEKQNITFEADSTLSNNEINLTLSINPPTSEVPVDSLHPALDHKKYNVRNTYIIIDYDYKEVLKNKSAFFASFDTTKLQDNIYLLCKGKPYVKPQVVLNCDYIKNNDLYNVADVEKTKLYLSQNLLFRQTLIDFVDVTASDTGSVGSLDCFIQISPSTKQSYSINLEGTNTGGDWGAQTKATYENKNLFRGAEIYSMKARYSFEQDNMLAVAKSNKFNSSEYGIDLSIISPKFILPFASSDITKKYGLKTFVKAGYSFQIIPYYERPLRYLSLGYISKNNKYLTQFFTPFEINGVQYVNRSDAFNEFITQHSYYGYSYQDYFISSSSYALQWQNKNPEKLQNYSFFKYSIESAGNILYGLSKLTNRAKVNGSYQMFKTPIAQYVKSEVDYRYYKVEGKELTTVYRILFGGVIPYGNVSTVPNIKEYFAGGSMSMRAWSLRSLGPGRYMDTASIKYAMADIKLEMNIEQRFPVFRFLNAAIFTDIGNIWSTRKIAGQPGAEFSPLFFNDLAVATGVGLRPNFSFFVFRVDFAVKMRDPSLDPSKQWLFIDRKFSFHTNPDWNLTIGIGYPF